ncbi:MAG: putative molybdenum carrier protein [Gammaproteobacteria bacterium]|nr:putative molybdenum carrier protein [Gammaproteobacteria bacterium]
MANNEVLIKIISGGQTGVDRGALDAALAAGIPCGGWCPKGRLAEDGVIDPTYPLQEVPSEDYRVRTMKNIAESDGTVIIYFGKLEGGTLNTVEYCRQQGKPHLLINTDYSKPEQAAHLIKKFILEKNVITLNVAGPRASKVQRARTYTQTTIAALLRLLYADAPAA